MTELPHIGSGARQMRLTPDLVAKVPPHDGTTGLVSTRSDRPTDADYDAACAYLLKDCPASGEVWIFAYGSLIWNPEFAFVEERLGTVQGWHRSFCLGWVRIYRGTPERPGIMLAMDRGGSCRGVAFRLPIDAVESSLITLLRREMPIKRDPPEIPARWLTVRTDQGDIRAIAFPISRSHPAYLPDLTEGQVVEALATAAGERGSMAEYLHSTVSHLEQRGIHDRYLWRMQELVADRIAQISDAALLE
ncbi:MAG: gamma-glutamylcyclotransferase [Paracoccaceae bacterium]